MRRVYRYIIARVCFVLTIRSDASRCHAVTQRNQKKERRLLKLGEAVLLAKIGFWIVALQHMSNGQSMGTGARGGLSLTRQCTQRCLITRTGRHPLRWTGRLSH